MFNRDNFITTYDYSNINDFNDFIPTYTYISNYNNERDRELLKRCIQYIIDVWSINEKEIIKEKFKNILDFTEAEIKMFEIGE